MTSEQLKELERLSERWANDCPSVVDEPDIYNPVMDLLPDVLQHIKELERGILGMHQSVQSMELTRKGIEAERDAALKASAELLSWATMLANDAIACAPTAPGRLAITLHRWFERDHQPDKPWGSGYVPKSELDAALKACAEMRALLESVRELAPDFLDDENGHFSKLCDRALSTDCGKGYHADSEWEQIVEALRQVDQCGMEHFKAFSCACAGGIKQALAHAERITGKEEV